MSIITLTTDFGRKDYSVAAVKGAIYSTIVDVKIVDISHEVRPFNVIETAYILKNAYHKFPKGSVHIIGVNSEYSSTNKHVIFELNDHFFIGADNGIISMIALENTPSKIIEIPSENIKKSSFPTLDVFANYACEIIKNKGIKNLGKEITSFKKLTETQPKINSSKTIIKGQVIYIDNYENVVTNISKPFFNTFLDNRDFTISAGRYNFKEIHHQYNNIVDFSSEKLSYFEGKRLAIFNNNDFLEIAIYKGNLENGGAASLLGLGYRDTITIEFLS